LRRLLWTTSWPNHDPSIGSQPVLISYGISFLRKLLMLDLLSSWRLSLWASASKSGRKWRSNILYPAGISGHLSRRSGCYLLFAMVDISRNDFCTKECHAIFCHHTLDHRPPKPASLSRNLDYGNPKAILRSARLRKRSFIVGSGDTSCWYAHLNKHTITPTLEQH
jgi:hypothetical protein